MNKKLITAIIIFLVSFGVLGICLYFYSLAPVSLSDEKVVKFEVKEGSSTKSIIKSLKEADLIKNDKTVLIYLKFNKNITLKAGTYELNKTMAADEILNELDEGNSIEAKGMTITFIEGKRLSNYVNIISEKFGYETEDIYEELSNKDFLNNLINKYWFITDEILNEDIYYPLEGYLYPDTYIFKQDSSVSTIVTKLLDTLESKLEPYKEKIKNNKYSFHEVLSLASDVELEGHKADDRKLIAGVFLNRLNKNMSLGSDVTTYYAVNKSMDEELWMKDLNTINPYNTRGGNMLGKINIGPICNPSLSSIVAVLEPTVSDYFYFYADYKGDGTVYYSKTLTEHNQTVAKFEN